MRYTRGNVTVGDVGVTITATADIDLTGKSIYFHIIKPNNEVILREANVSGRTASYTTVDGDLDVSGEWVILVKDHSSGYYFTNESGNIIVVRPKPDEMAKG